MKVEDFGVYTVEQFVNNFNKITEHVNKSRAPVFITKHGEPFIEIVPEGICDKFEYLNDCEVGREKKN